MDRWFWKLSSLWDPPPTEGYSRHGVEDTDRLLDRFEAARPWKSRKVVALKSERKTKLEDFPFCFLPVMSSRAMEALRDLLAPDGEFVPADLFRSGKRLARYHIFNCLRRYDAFDRERSESDTAKGLDFGTVDPLLRLNYGRVPDGVNAFRCKGYMDKLLVSELVAERLSGSILSGWMLRDPQDPPWRRKPIASPHRP